MDLLLFSNSTNAGEDYFDFPLPYIHETIKDSGIQQAVFIPYAAITITYDEYTQKVTEKLQTIGLQVSGIHTFTNKQQAIDQAKCIIVGGGNTFHLLKQLQQFNLLQIIQKKVIEGTLYIGWSAGSNLACPTIKTTNDMPVVEPDNFNALNLIPYQINPHFTKETIPNHGGESREMRLNEFIKANPNTFVLALPEGCLINYMHNQAILLGDKPAFLFHNELKEPLKVECGSIIEMPQF